MKRAEFDTRLDDSDTLKYQTQKGLVSKNFGIHKTLDGDYNITHLNTGELTFSFDKQKDAKVCVSLMEEINKEQSLGFETLTKENMTDKQKDAMFDCYYKVKGIN